MFGRTGSSQDRMVSKFILKWGIYNSDAVRELQEVLVNLGYEPLAIDGDFEDETDGAVRRFQDASALELVDGKVGFETLTALFEATYYKLPPSLTAGLNSYFPSPGDFSSDRDPLAAPATVVFHTQPNFRYGGRHITYAGRNDGVQPLDGWTDHVTVLDPDDRLLFESEPSHAGPLTSSQTYWNSVELPLFPKEVDWGVEYRVRVVLNANGSGETFNAILHDDDVAEPWLESDANVVAH
jgi:peptidoglycan hydrolase-like protein with peptidoglycan-binding domain